jgi:hypothetical protein
MADGLFRALSQGHHFTRETKIPRKKSRHGTLLCVSTP